MKKTNKQTKNSKKKSFCLGSFGTHFVHVL